MRTVFLVVALSVIAALSVRVAFPGAARIRNRGERFARQHLAFVDSEFVAAFNRSTVRVNRIGGSVLLITLSVAVVLMSRARSDEAVAVELLPVLAVTAGSFAALRLWAAGHELPVPPGRRTVARPRRVVSSDYVPPILRGLSWFLVADSVALAFLAIAEPGRTAFDVSTPVLAVAMGVVIGVALLTEVLASAACRRPQSAVDPCHLYVQDALRSEFLVGSYGVIAGCAFLLMLGSMSVDSVAAVLYACGVAAYVASPVVGLVERNRFRVRLWPTLAPGQVLLPDQPVPPKVGAPA